MRRDDAPGALDEELKHESAELKLRGAKGPQSDKASAEEGACDDATTAAPVLGEVTNDRAASDGANVVDDSSDSDICGVVVLLFREERRVKILRAMGHEVEEGLK
ncbi:LOW QUALITY PROTEIN: hypothetical protein BC937DRAFT_87570 [Endogone sp. FLAS-F59071]|nr:LOW QUALITY PROTEIN: hypothetical protein BC937DRAFT_87570 [Endogone sp. FLAS-F59071]|eukprot:RUS19388.1 LOW QUALITY PROTEIN: hypothetical protein BC937DRAFT_87570 [Endogone sp. FLAS-F59071]